MNANSKAKASGLRLGQLLRIDNQEIGAVAWSFAYFFCVLSAYYILRPIRETMAVGSGPDTIPLLFLGTFIATLIATSLFGLVVSKYPRRVFLPWVYLFFVFNILAFSYFFNASSSSGDDNVWLGRTFFVWLSVFNLFVVSVFWSFMADIYTREQGRRLFGVIAAGGSIGALLGGIATSLLVEKIGFAALFPISASLLVAAVLCIRRLRRWVTRDDNPAESDINSRKPLGGNPFSGITHAFSSKYFTAIVVSSVIASLLGTALYMFMAELVEVAYDNADSRTRFFSNINNATNALTIIFQLLIVKLAVGRFGLGRALAIMPFVSVIGFLVLANEPTLMVVAALTVARRALGFGFSKPTTDMLYSVVTPEEKYKTKNFIDTAVYRGGDLVGTWSVKWMLQLGIAGVSYIMVPFAVIWTLVSLWLGRDYRRRARELKESGLS